MEDSKEILTKEETQRRLQHKRHWLSQTNLVLKIPDVIGKEYFHYLHEKKTFGNRHRNFRRNVES